MPKTFRGFARERDQFTMQLDRELSRLILRSQKVLRTMIISELTSRLSIGSGSFVSSPSNILAASDIIDTVFQRWTRTQGVDIVNFIGKNIFDIHALNTRYYSSFLNVSDVMASGDKVLSMSLSKYGVNADGTINPSGYLADLITDRSMARQMKSTINTAISTEKEVGKLISDVNQSLGTNGAGLLEQKMSEGLPSGMLQVDRETNNNFATDLKLDYAIYQGGEIKTTRPFCLERNGKVFSREEIERFGTSRDQFGGYTNKSQGQFQGKTKIYDPFEDLGGYNCRHFYSWISERMAFAMRPDLK